MPTRVSHFVKHLTADKITHRNEVCIVADRTSDILCVVRFIVDTIVTSAQVCTRRLNRK